MRAILVALALAMLINGATAQVNEQTTRSTPGLSTDHLGPATGGAALTRTTDDVPLPGSPAFQPTKGSTGESRVPGVSANGLRPEALVKSPKD